jgi:hypothetical protein
MGLQIKGYAQCDFLVDFLTAKMREAAADAAAATAQLLDQNKIKLINQD